MVAKGIAGRSGLRRPCTIPWAVTPAARVAGARRRGRSSGHGAGRRSDARRTHGAALVTVVSLLLLTSGVVLYTQLLRTSIAPAARAERTAASLARAKTALIARAATASAPTVRQITPGLLPFPDRRADGNYDGRGDCVTFGLNASHLLGRLPRAGDVNPCPRIGLGVVAADAAGEPLWYAVSRNLVTRGSAIPVSPGILEPGAAAYPWIVVRDARGRVVEDAISGGPLAVAAVVIAPGAPLRGQNRQGAAPAPANYLDRIRIGATIYDNADADGCPDGAPPACSAPSAGEEFILHSGGRARGGFNDRLAYIGAAEILRALERRVLGEVAVALNRYRDAYGAYPWLCGYRDPRVASFKSDGARHGLLPVHLHGETFRTRFHAAWTFVDATPSTRARHSGAAALVPPVSDLLSGSLTIDESSGRCVWSEATRGDCRGSRVLSAHYRSDLGTTVTRTVELAFDIEDDTPRIVPPGPTDVRRRSLSARVAAPGAATIRITDADGAGWGRRDVRIDGDTSGSIALDGIRYELSVVYDDVADARDEMPEWLVDNDWHHYVYAALSQDAAPGGDADGDGDCATPVDTCLSLTVAGKTVRSDIRALLVSAGAARPGQDRAVGDCDGDGRHDDFLCAYFEGANGERSTPVAADTYARNAHSAAFNDQVRVVAPLPP